MTRYLLAFVLFALSSFGSDLQAQDKEEFKPYGRAFGRIFANFHEGISEASSEEAAFDLVRAYLGYEHFLSKEFSAKINVDIGSPNDLSEFSKIRRYAYFKNAYVQYKKSGFTYQFGLISLKQFELQEKIWERRYMKKSFADEYKLGSSADLGMMAEYKFSNLFSADLTMINGEGYSSLQSDDIFKYAVGATLTPGKSFLFRGYVDYMKDEIAQITPVVFVSYTYKGNFNIAGEYNYQFNNNHKEGQDIFGYSVFSKYNLNKKLQLFARYDQLQSSILKGKTTPWQLTKDGTTLIGGVQYSPVKGIKVALDYQDWYPWAANVANKSYIFLDLEVSL
ncbi:MAG: hypothetical protein A2066_19210 [Bacteroidetes bacterium GWB2_41_8]|nr:MAG: hypothetical protein A2066_19210 [Bacteroidetes bacterium GWB2_41_8]